MSLDTIKLVEAFYCDDENSRIMPGKKDYVSIARNVHLQKKLLLCNLNELYSAFVLQYPDIKIGRSKFIALRPYCIIAGASGTHSVCVCTIHQNSILILDPINGDYKELFKLMFCDPSSKNCMLSRCETCPKDNTRLTEELYRLDTEIEFKQWTTNNRSSLVTMKENVAEYVNMVINKLTDLAHSYLAKSQCLS